MGAEGYSVQTIALNPCHPGCSFKLGGVPRSVLSAIDRAPHVVDVRAVGFEPGRMSIAQLAQALTLGERIFFGSVNFCGVRASLSIQQPDVLA
jgi:hypothetical protein